MSACKLSVSENPVEIDEFDYVAFIRNRMDVEGVSIRALTEKSGIKRTRLGSILHGTKEKRLPLTVLEKDRILRALGSSGFEAMLAMEIARLDPKIIEATAPMLSMLSTAMTGLAGRFAEVMGHIDGLESADIRDEHGRLFQEAFLGMAHEIYSDIARRREERMRKAFDDVTGLKGIFSRD